MRWHLPRVASRGGLLNAAFEFAENVLHAAGATRASVNIPSALLLLNTGLKNEKLRGERVCSKQPAQVAKLHDQVRRRIRHTSTIFPPALVPFRREIAKDMGMLEHWQQTQSDGPSPKPTVLCHWNDLQRVKIIARGLQNSPKNKKMHWSKESARS